jgi:hypothetical protein
MKRIFALLLFSSTICCNKTDIGCTDCESPSLAITFLDAESKQKIVVSKLTVIHNVKDTAQFNAMDIKNASSGAIGYQDSIYSVYWGTGNFSIIVEDTRYGNNSFENIFVRDDNSVCKRIYTKHIEIDLTKGKLGKKLLNGTIVNQHETLGC